MTYIERLNAFWESYRNAEERYTEAEVALYMMLLDIFNRNKWPEGGVKISTTYLCDTLSISRKKLTVTREALKVRRLIHHENSQGSSSPFYLLPENLCFAEETQSNLCCAHETQKETQTALCFARETQKETQIKENPPIPLKEIYKDNNPPSLSAAAHAYTWRPPTKEEVLSMANQIMMPAEDAEDFFLYYESQGWMLANGLPMKNWQTKLQQRNNEDRAERAKAQMAGPAVKERSRRGVDNSGVETQTPDTPEILAKQGILRMIETSADKVEARRIANKAYELRGTFEGAMALINYALRDNNVEARRMLGVG